MAAATTTLRFGDRAPHASAAARADGDALFLPAAELAAATGWELKPEGACLGEVCVPLPAAARGEDAAGGDGVDVAWLARALGRPVVHEGAAWVAGEAAAARADALASLAAPDFELPDLDGRLHRLSHYRGRKVLILSWASW